MDGQATNAIFFSYHSSHLITFVQKKEDMITIFLDLLFILILILLLPLPFVKK